MFVPTQVSNDSKVCLLRFVFVSKNPEKVSPQPQPSLFVCFPMILKQQSSLFVSFFLVTLVSKYSEKLSMQPKFVCLFVLICFKMILTTTKTTKGRNDPLSSDPRDLFKDGGGVVKG